MAPNANNDLPQLIEKLAVTELMVAGFYAACIPIGGVFGILCEEMRKEEVVHATYLRILKRRVRRDPSRFRPGRPFHEKALQAFITYVREGRQNVLDRQLTRRQILAFALNVEQGLLESRPWEVIESDDVEIKVLMEQMRVETEAHRHRLQEQLGRCQAA